MPGGAFVFGVLAFSIVFFVTKGAKNRFLWALTAFVATFIIAYIDTSVR